MVGQGSGAVINIAAGATSGSVNFPAPANTPYIDGGKVQKLDYVSASPYRVPIARLAAAQAALQQKALD